MKIEAKIEIVKYQPTLTPNLCKMHIDEHTDINELPSSCMIEFNGNTYGLSKWITPKRTRTYPYGRVYDTFLASKRVTIIPVVKDEGENTNKDFIQWDTIALMSLLDVYVIFAYYESADIHPKNQRRIANQQLNNWFIFKQLKMIEKTYSSSLHWNIEQVQKRLALAFWLAQRCYKKMYRQGLPVHDPTKGYAKRIKMLKEDVKKFKQFSRGNAKTAQNREIHTIQPKEALNAKFEKAPITIYNYLGGEYNFTVDEVEIRENKIILREAKHTKKGTLPSISDIKDGVFKMILYTNLDKVEIDGKTIDYIPSLKLTSPNIVYDIDTSIDDQQMFCKKIQQFNKKAQEHLLKLYKEAMTNGFILEIKKEV